MGEILVRISALNNTPDNTESLLYLNEVDGERVMILRFDPQLRTYMEIAIRGEQADDCDYLHGRFIQILKDRYNTVINKLTIAAEIADKDKDEMSVVTLIHFTRANEKFAERFAASDAFGLAAYSGCPIYIEESIFNRASFIPKKKQTDDKANIDAATDAAQAPLDKLPKA